MAPIKETAKDGGTATIRAGQTCGKSELPVTEHMVTTPTRAVGFASLFAILAHGLNGRRGPRVRRGNKYHDETIAAGLRAKFQEADPATGPGGRTYPGPKPPKDPAEAADRPNPFRKPAHQRRKFKRLRAAQRRRAAAVAESLGRRLPAPGTVGVVRVMRQDVRASFCRTAVVQDRLRYVVRLLEDGPRDAAGAEWVKGRKYYVSREVWSVPRRKPIGPPPLRGERLVDRPRPPGARRDATMKLTVRVRHDHDAADRLVKLGRNNAA
jgi:hypothetical protein